MTFSYEMFLTSQASGWLGIQIFQMSPGLILSDFLWMEPLTTPWAHGFWAHYISKAWTKHHPKKVQHGSTADQQKGINGLLESWHQRGWLEICRRAPLVRAVKPLVKKQEAQIKKQRADCRWDLPAVGSMVLKKAGSNSQLISQPLTRFHSARFHGSAAPQLWHHLCHFFFILKLLSHYHYDTIPQL